MDGHRKLAASVSHNAEQRHAANEPDELTRRLAEQARIFDVALSTIPDFAYICACAGRFSYANQRLLDLWGLRLADVVGKNFFDLQYPDALATKLQRQIQQVCETNLRKTQHA